MEIKDLMYRGTCFVVAGGESIDKWKHPWIPWIESSELRAAFNPPRSGVNRPIITVSDLLIQGIRGWDENFLNQVF